MTMLDDGWYPFEPWGQWLKNQDGCILANLGPQHDPGFAFVRLGIVTAGDWQGNRLQLCCPQSGSEVILTLRAGADYDVTIGMPLPSGPISFRFAVDRFDAVVGNDPRLLSIGVSAFGIASANNKHAVTALSNARLPGRRLNLTAAPIGAPPTLWSKVHSALKRYATLR